MIIYKCNICKTTFNYLPEDNTGVNYCWICMNTRFIEKIEINKERNIKLTSRELSLAKASHDYWQERVLILSKRLNYIESDSYIWIELNNNNE
jgi:hypothetical protein